MTSTRHATVLLDVGNTRIKAGWHCDRTGQRESTVLALAHHDLDQLPAWLSREKITATRALGTNVAGKVLAVGIEQALGRAGVQAVHWLRGSDYAIELNISNDYEHPQQLGADRWVAMLGLATHGHNPGEHPLLLASFGTATTVDTLFPTQTGWLFSGGLILPGVELMRQVLATQTAELPAAHGTVAEFPKNTHQAITSGIVAAQVGAVIRQWQASWQRDSLAPLVFCTGGNWPTVATELQAQLRVMQQLYRTAQQPAKTLAAPVLDGLANVARLQSDEDDVIA